MWIACRNEGEMKIVLAVIGVIVLLVLIFFGMTISGTLTLNITNGPVVIIADGQSGNSNISITGSVVNPTTGPGNSPKRC